PLLSPLFPYTTLFRSPGERGLGVPVLLCRRVPLVELAVDALGERVVQLDPQCARGQAVGGLDEQGNQLVLGVVPDLALCEDLCQDRKSTRLNSSHVSI